MRLLIVSDPEKEIHFVVKQLDYNDCGRFNYVPGLRYYGIPIYASLDYSEALKEYRSLKKKAAIVSKNKP